MHQRAGDPRIRCDRGRLRVRDGDQLRLLIAALGLGRGAGLAIEREAVGHGLEVAAGIDEERAQPLRPGIRIDGKEARAHIAAGDIGLHDDRVAIVVEDAAAERERMVRSRQCESGQMPIFEPSRLGLTN